MREADSTAVVRRRARDLFRRAYRAQVRGEVDEAIRLYQESIGLHPSAEAFTFLGWAHSFRKDYERALACCRSAINLDPDFGNPYNDIGAYLIELGQWDEAVPWLRAATRARRYASHHFPHYNLGRVHEHNFDWDLAESEYVLALRIEPRYELAQQSLRRLRIRRN
jgi:tetratricopeptide (TPR) repeat protein